MHQSGVDALVVDDGGLATPCRYSPPLVRLAVNTLTYCTARRKYSVTVTCGNVRYCVRKQTDIFYDISVSSPPRHGKPPSPSFTPRPFLAATHFREHKTRETLCRTQEYEVHEALERHPNADLLESSIAVKSVELYMISIQSPFTWYQC